MTSGPDRPIYILLGEGNKPLVSYSIELGQTAWSSYCIGDQTFLHKVQAVPSMKFSSGGAEYNLSQSYKGS